MRESDEPLTDTLVRCLADQAALRLDAALEDNRARVRRQLGRDWAWAVF